MSLLIRIIHIEMIQDDLIHVVEPNDGVTDSAEDPYDQYDPERDWREKTEEDCDRNGSKPQDASIKKQERQNGR